MAGVIQKRTQWNSLRTFKFTVDYQAFQPDATNNKEFILFQLSQKTMLVSFKVKHSAIFSGEGGTKANLFLKWGVSGVPFNQQEALLGKMDLKAAVANTTGLFQTMPQLKTSAVANAPTLIFNNDFATDIFLQLVLDAGKKMDDLTQGSFEVWFTTMRNV